MFRKYFFLIAIAIFAIVFFYPTVLQGKIPTPTDTLVGLYYPWRDIYTKTNPNGVPFKNFLITDPVRQQIPWRKLVVDAIKRNETPRWNPYNAMGTPLAGNPQAASAYPLNILFFVLPFQFAWTIFIMLSPLLSGIFFYLFARSKKISFWGSLVGSVAWSYSSFAITWLTWGTLGHVLLWLPLLLLSVDKILNHSHAKASIWWGLVFVVALISAATAGHTQLFFYVVTAVFLYCFWQILSLSLPQRVFGAMHLFILGIISLIVLYILQKDVVTFVTFTNRVSGMVDWHKDGWFLPWAHVIQFIVPDFFGNPATLNYWGTWNYGELTGYIGIVPFIFALTIWTRKIQKDAVFFVLLGILTLTFMLPSPLSAIPFVTKIPFISSLQPTRLMSLVVFSLSMLSAYGVDIWMSEKRDKKIWIPFVGVGIVLGIIWILVVVQLKTGLNASVKANLLVTKNNLLFPSVIWSGALVLFFMYDRFFVRRRNIAMGAICMLVVFELFRFGWKFTPFTPLEYFFPKTNITSFLASQEGVFRVVSLDDQIAPSNALAYYGIESPEAYDPLLLSRYEEFMSALDRNTPDTRVIDFNRIVTARNIQSKLFPLLSARYLLSKTDVTVPGKNVFTDGQTKVTEYSHWLPRVYLVKTVIPVRTKQNAMDTMFEAQFDPSQWAVIEADTVHKYSYSTSDVASLESYTADSLSIVTTTATGGFLVILNANYPGWHAQIDEKSVQLLQTNYLFQGVWVPSGTHSIYLHI